MVFHKILFPQDKREVEASLALGLTMRGIQIFQVCIGEGEEYQMVVVLLQECLCEPARLSPHLLCVGTEVGGVSHG